MREQQQYRGSCMCGAIRYEFEGEIGEIVQCHCKRCQKANGTAFATNAPIQKQTFRFTQGKDVLKKYRSSDSTERCFCGECGSPIISIKSDTPEYYRLRLGTLDTEIEQKPTKHIYVAYKAKWDTICDALPQFDERA